MTSGADFLTIEQAAAALGVSAWAVRKYIKAGRLTAYKAPIGRKTLIRAKDLDAFKKPKRIPPPAKGEPGE